MQQGSYIARNLVPQKNSLGANHIDTGWLSDLTEGLVTGIGVTTGLVVRVVTPTGPIRSVRITAGSAKNVRATTGSITGVGATTGLVALSSDQCRSDAEQC